MSVCHRSRAQSNLHECQPVFLLLEVISKTWKLIFKRRYSRELYLQRHNLVEYTVLVNVTNMARFNLESVGKRRLSSNSDWNENLYRLRILFHGK